MKKPASAGFFAECDRDGPVAVAVQVDQTICALSRLTPAVELKPQST